MGLAGRLCRGCSLASTSFPQFLPARSYTKPAQLQGIAYRYVHLKDRRLARVSGVDALSLLQGLTTNDMGHLEGHAPLPALHTLILNNAGRVVHDIIIYNCDSGAGPDLILESHADRFQPLMDLLKKYRMRKKVEITSCAESLSSFAMYPEIPLDFPLDELRKEIKKGPLLMSEEETVANRAAVAFVNDPRSPYMGARFLLPAREDPTTCVATDRLPGTLQGYTRTRYAFGIGEAPAEIIPEKSLPLEVNGDYLQGISFHKGCYVGQELTARTHHTGVVRKRLLPIKLSLPVPPGTKVVGAGGVRAGEVRGVGEGGWGLGLLRLDAVLPSEGEPWPELTVPEGTVTTWLPPFWPSEEEAQVPGQVRGFAPTHQE